jgi:hypothetical protein
LSKENASATNSICFKATTCPLNIRSTSIFSSGFTLFSARSTTPATATVPNTLSSAESPARCTVFEKSNSCIALVMLVVSPDFTEITFALTVPLIVTRPSSTYKSRTHALQSTPSTPEQFLSSSIFSSAENLSSMDRSKVAILTTSRLASACPVIPVTNLISCGTNPTTIKSIMLSTSTD